MLSLLILARLLDYPDEALWQARGELEAALPQCREMTAQQQGRLQAFIAHYWEAPLATRQSDYITQFDHTRRCALYLCEHQLAESKNRGQAMVNILSHYRQAALEPAPRELPDYLPMVLEFAYLQSQRQPEEGRRILTQIAGVAEILYRRTHDGIYSILFQLLLQLAGRETDGLTPEADGAPTMAIDAEWDRAHAPARVELPDMPQGRSAPVHYLDLER
ncbi:MULTISPECIES: nitrate reductase molybdenum cofactor assembly chaperone [Edwardsiella]|uniref:Respiratory nitrate reductase delta chain n=2 Tax=Edwardsiella anguillarum TaxID=1821960 RepID=A0A076LIQ5_9GAMM|nr:MULTISPECIES: nitrate reductase molybdenum cofactor assembly chaperone [Edwardsiella]AKM46202.1 nitrate reductase [Edwardsiella sp. EA181011]GAJ68890.1 respiratory nitrate reductase subunit delta [Edwardsiella piscicida]AIJ08450.1 Respiratory nitrate reductase delta chain [Edwardsiella anguillarum ET080813]AKR76530.1 nitrate reductase molybdenum cofactor assembly chaperone [Edwardsiella sp. LADL05-105]KAB0588971.1 nitrate reductase molybdenum cofactor assembly chaperone [Edwardsiella anguil